MKTDIELLDFAAKFVSEIASLHSKRGEKLEVILQNGEADMVIIRRTARDEATAFRKCLLAAMVQRPKWK